jgi:GDSL/SGNH-like Acyl-Esterase family found in Pmr5 and Cas1p
MVSVSFRHYGLKNLIIIIVIVTPIVMIQEAKSLIIFPRWSTQWMEPFYFNSSNNNNNSQHYDNSSQSKNSSSDCSIQGMMSYTFGDHMEHIEFLPLQPWQIQTIQTIWNNMTNESNSQTKRRQRQSKRKNINFEQICHPPSDHVSTHFCCGGTTRKLIRPNSQWGHESNPWACPDTSHEDYEHVHKIVLERYIPPLPTYNNRSEFHNVTSDDRNIPCDVCRIIQLIWEQNLTLQFLGDSIMHQMVYGWICALQQRNYNVTTTMIPQDKTSFQIHVTSPHWTTNTSTLSSQDNHDRGIGNDNLKENHITMTFYNALGFPKSLSFWDQLEDVDILVINHGVHWAINATRNSKSPRYYRDHWNETLQYWSQLKQKSKKWIENTTRHPFSFPRLVAMRETSAQHFDSDSGEYYLRSHNTTKGCVAQPTMSYVGWREEVVTELALLNGYRALYIPSDGFGTNIDDWLQPVDPDSMEIVWLPFLNFTTELYFMHPPHRKRGDEVSNDCTHYCQTPYLWWPIWRSLRIAMDRTF